MFFSCIKVTASEREQYVHENAFALFSRLTVIFFQRLNLLFISHTVRKKYNTRRATQSLYGITSTEENFVLYRCTAVICVLYKN